MSIDSIRHSHSERSHIPSQQEAGMEAASPAVQGGKAQADFPKNPVVHRGQDPELFWLGKYGENDQDDRLQVDIRSLYRAEHVAPETLIQNLYRVTEADDHQPDLFNVNTLFGNALERDELSKVSEYYQHRDGWTNRLIQGDSLLVMTSLLEREGMAEQVQTIYIDPPYGIKYGSNWQIKLNSRSVGDSDKYLSGEPEVIKAYRDTWELGIHSYLSYLRDRLVVAHELLSDTGSIFVQISDENVHLVRCLIDEIFGGHNFCSQIIFRKTTGKGSSGLDNTYDLILWYAKDKEQVKHHALYFKRKPSDDYNYRYVELPDGTRRTLTKEERHRKDHLPDDWKIFRPSPLTSQSASSTTLFAYKFEGETFKPRRGGWKTNIEGMERLDKANRLIALGNTLSYVRYFNDYPYQAFNDIWDDTRQSGFGDPKIYTVQTGSRVIERCILMTTDPGDLVLDPTCGSGTTAFVAELWGRRWITVDSSRIALNVAKQRMMTAVYPYFTLHDENSGDIRLGFVYKTVPHIMLKHIARGEEPEVETLYDQPEEDEERLRVAGPFTVETLQAFEPVAPEDLDATPSDDDEAERFEQRVFEHLKSAGIKNGIREEQAVFSRVERLSDAYLHAEGFYTDAKGQERKAYFHIGPRFGTVSKQAVNEAVKACRNKGDAEWLVILGFSFESTVENRQAQTVNLGTFEVTKTRMADDLMQQGLLKKDKKAASFVTIGEPDIALHRDGDTVTVEVRGLDIYDPIKDQVKARSAADISYWMVDDDYDGSNFVVRQVFFCGGPKDAFKDWKKGLNDLAKRQAKKSAEQTLRIEIDDEAFDRLYGFQSHPISVKSDEQQVAVRIISQFGEESTKVLDVSEALMAA